MPSHTPEPTSDRGEPSSLKSRVVSGFAWLAATKAIGQAITWLITLVVLRLLSPGDYGLMGMSMIFISFLLIFKELGIGTAVVQARKITAEELSSLRWAMLGIGVGLFGIVLLVAPTVAYYFREPELVGIVRTLGLGFVFAGMGAPSMLLLQRDISFKQKSLAELAATLTASVTAVTLAALGYGVWSLVLAYVFQEALVNVLYCIYRPVPFASSFSLRSLARFVDFGAHVTVARLLWYVSVRADGLIVARVLGATQLGLYGIAFQFSSIPIEKIVTLLNQVAFPSFSAIQDDHETLRRYFLKLVGIVGFVSFPMFAGLILIADDAASTLLKPEWASITVPLKLLCVASCLRAVGAVNAPLFMAKGRPGFVSFNNLLRAIVMPIAFYAGAQYGIEGVALAWLVAWPPLYGVATFQALNLIGLRFGQYVTALKHPVLGSVSMLLLVGLVDRFLLSTTPSLFTLLARCLLGSSLYLAYFLIFSRSTVSEVASLLRNRARQTSGGRKEMPERSVRLEAPVRVQGD